MLYRFLQRLSAAGSTPSLALAPPWWTFAGLSAALRASRDATHAPWSELTPQGRVSDRVPAAPDVPVVVAESVRTVTESARPLRVVIAIGTRPEAIKLAPVVHELTGRPDEFETIVVSTGQHREMLRQVFEATGIQPDVDLDLMRHGQGLVDFAALALPAFSEVCTDLKPDIILVQGDTTTVTMAALAGYYNGVAVGHVEAGLRSFDMRSPFPEEGNRRVAGTLTDYHFAPTEGARQNLLREGSPPTACS